MGGGWEGRKRKDVFQSRLLSFPSFSRRKGREKRGGGREGGN